MGRKLIITEKPSVARDFARVLGVEGKRKGYLENGEYIITWCVGHLVEMLYPEGYDPKYKKWRLEDLPFLPEQYLYGVIPSVREQYQLVHGFLHDRQVDTVYWAGDSGKEGQTIEENIRSYGGVREGLQELRVWIDTQTDEEIRRGIREARPMQDYALLGESGVMRSIEDYALGINFSRALSVKYARQLNEAAGTKSYVPIAVGRVMSCVLGMVVRREREIRDFVKLPFYRVLADLEGIQAEWRAPEERPGLYKNNGFLKKEDAEAMAERLKAAGEALCVKAEKKKEQKKPPLLYNLAELQHDCSSRFKLSPDETLAILQELYEKKLLSYPRTDARVLTKALAAEIGKNLRGISRLPQYSGFTAHIQESGSYKHIAGSRYTDDSQVTDHYAIIPTGEGLGALKSLKETAADVYDLVVRRFLSIFYPPAVYEKLALEFEADGEGLFANFKVLREPGYLAVAGRTEEDASTGEGLPQVKKGKKLQIRRTEVKAGETSPPKRYTSGSMILAMENAGQLIEDEELREQIRKSGIGTSATRAEIIKKLIRIRYLKLNKKTQVLTPEKFGELVYEILSLTTPSLLDPQMSASWEKGLAGIVSGEIPYRSYRAKLEDYIRRETVGMIRQDAGPALRERIRLLERGGKSSAAAGVSVPNAAPNAKAAGPADRVQSSAVAGPAEDGPLRIFCPICGSPLLKKNGRYLCSRHQELPGGSCAFSVGSIAGISLEEARMEELCTRGVTAPVSGFQGNSGEVFAARVALKRDEKGGIVGLRLIREQASP